MSLCHNSKITLNYYCSVCVVNSFESNLQLVFISALEICLSCLPVFSHYCTINIVCSCSLYDFVDDEPLLVKLLIPSSSAGIILGKGGETIICLQSQYCVNIKLSKAGDFFPGSLMNIVFVENFCCML